MPTIIDHALQMLSPGMTIGLGSGRAASQFIQALGRRVQEGLDIRGVPTSEASAQLARQRGIPLVDLDDVPELDLAIDGADEVDPQLNLIKGYGGALVREKIVAASARRFVILAGAEKLVAVLGSRGKLPVEIVPFSLPLCQRRLEALGWATELRMHGDQPVVSDNGNWTLDCRCQPLDRPGEVERAICAIPGVVDCGLFLEMADVVLVQDQDRVLERK